MDVVVDIADYFVLDEYVFGDTLEKGSLERNAISLFLVLWIGGTLMYLCTAFVSYHTLYDHNDMKSKHFIPGQIKLEIQCALWNIPWMSLPTVLVTLPELYGYAVLYDRMDEYGYMYALASMFLFLLFTDFGIYWVHRLEHDIPWVYKNVHKPHHRWIVTTPFASHAFHWADGFAQSLPYHIFVYLIPMHKYLYIGMFVFVNFWTVSIHDGNVQVPESLAHIINGCAHHIDHHTLFTCNYGQFFTLWDKLGGSFRFPNAYREGGRAYTKKNQKPNRIKAKAA
eukprot:Clim_evm59s153 gene=Clim_evmTU59s153